MQAHPNSHRRWPLAGREIAALLAIKLVALTLIYFLFFAAPPPHLDAAAHLLAAGPSNR